MSARPVNAAVGGTDLPRVNVAVCLAATRELADVCIISDGLSAADRGAVCLMHSLGSDRAVRDALAIQGFGRHGIAPRARGKGDCRPRGVKGDKA